MVGLRDAASSFFRVTRISPHSSHQPGLQSCLATCCLDCNPGDAKVLLPGQRSDPTTPHQASWLHRVRAGNSLKWRSSKSTTPQALHYTVLLLFFHLNNPRPSLSRRCSINCLHVIWETTGFTVGSCIAHMMSPMMEFRCATCATWKMTKKAFFGKSLARPSVGSISLRSQH